MGGHGDDELGERAIAYAERAVEDERMPSWDAFDAYVARMCSGEVGEEMARAQVADMEAVKRMLATAFVMGWQAATEEPARRGRALGGVADDVRRGRRTHSTAPRSPRRRRTEGE